MKYTIRDLLASGKFPMLHLLYGAEGIEREVKGIRIIEVEDMERFLYGNDILLTSFKVYQSMSRQNFLTHLEGLLKTDVSAFIVKRRTEYDPEGMYFNCLVQTCSKYYIPVLEIPQDLYYWEIIKYVMVQIFDKNTARLTYFKLTHDNFTSILLKRKDVSKITQDVLYLLDKMLGNPVALYYCNNVCFASTNQDMSRFVLKADAEEYHPDIITKFEYLKQQTDYVQYIVKLDILGRVVVHLVITEQNSPLTGLDYMALENAIITLQYSFISSFVQNEIEKKYQRDIGYSMLSGMLSNSEMDDVAHMIDLSAQQTYRVIEFHTIPKSADGKYTNEQLEEVGIIEGELTRLLPEKTIYRNMNQIFYIHAVPDGEGELEFRKQMEELQRTVQKQIVHRKMDTDFQVGIGKVVQGYRKLKESFEDAKRALKYIDLIRTMFGDPTISVLDCSKLGFFQMFDQMQEPEELLQYVPESLKRLYRHDKEHNGELMETLQVYLDNNLSAKKASQELNVHYRTITYRIEKIQEISGIDFHNVSEMLAVRNGLVLLKIAMKK